MKTPDEVLEKFKKRERGQIGGILPYLDALVDEVIENRKRHGKMNFDSLYGERANNLSDRGMR